jgi:D-3-phosphoglycerate dehydrogenase / 2-oxoglutarate reductase
MPANRKRLVVPTSMGAGGFEVLKTRDDVEVVPFAAMITSPDFNALLTADGEVHGAILGLTRFGETEAKNAKGLQVVSRIGVGYDTVDVPALTRVKVPLMVAGTANSPSVAEQAMHFMFALAKRGAELNAMVKANRWGDRFKSLPIDLIGKTLIIVGFGRIGTRVAKRCLAMEMNVLVYDPYVPAAAVRMLIGARALPRRAWFARAAADRPKATARSPADGPSPSRSAACSRDRARS